MAIIAAETTTGRAAEGGHWYDRNGAPVYEIRGANGQMRSVTLRDARKLNLVPGFSAIAQMEYKPALERWKIEQALMAALTLPRLDGEDDGAFLARAREDAQEQARKAADRGTAIHAAIQGYFEGAPVAADFIPYVESVKGYLFQRFGTDGWCSERSFAHELGYGGKVDLCGPAVVDFKTKDFDETKAAKELAWPEHCMQLTCYAHGLGVPTISRANIFVSTRKPGLIRTREWDTDECESAWEAFRCLLRLWQIRRNYHCAFAREAA